MLNSVLNRMMVETKLLDIKHSHRAVALTRLHELRSMHVKCYIHVITPDKHFQRKSSEITIFERANILSRNHINELHASEYAN